MAIEKSLAIKDVKTSCLSSSSPIIHPASKDLVIFLAKITILNLLLTNLPREANPGLSLIKSKVPICL
jgi:hypothetical protein